MAELGLSQHHESVIINYMKFARYLRSQNEKQIEHTFQDIESRLFDDTYTKEEVQEHLLNLKKILKCDMESDLINFSHNNILMLQQLFKQAEKWYLRLNIDISELQNQELLGVVQKLETEGPFLRAQINVESTEDIEKNSVALLRMEIDRLKEDNERLSTIIQEVEDKSELYREEKNRLNDKLTNAQKEIGNYKVLLEQPRSRDEDISVVKELEEKLRKLETSLSMKNEEINSDQVKLRTELVSTKEKLKQVQAQLQLTEMELERKFSETKAYANMKQILLKKNDQIRRLREIAQKYEGNCDEVQGRIDAQTAPEPAREEEGKRVERSASYLRKLESAEKLVETQRRRRRAQQAPVDGTDQSELLQKVRT